MPCALLAACIPLIYHSRLCNQEVNTRVSDALTQVFSATKLNLLSENGQFIAVDELFSGKWRQYERRPDSFAEVQAKLAKFAGEAAINRGEHLVECLQGMR